MSNLKNAIKAENRGDERNVRELIIEQKLNKLFYLPQDIDEELKFLTIKRGNEPDVERYGLHASAIITSDNEFCVRSQVLSLFFRQLQGQQFGVHQKRVFLNGDFVHEKWQRLFIRGGLGTARNMDRSRFNDDYDLSFTPDAVINLNGVKYVVEIKSQNSFQFKKAKSHPSGMRQLKFYMFLTEIHRGFVLVEDKNDQEFRVYLADYEYEDVEKYEDRLIEIQRYKKIFKKEGKVPSRMCRKSDCKRALECCMRDACWDMGIGRKRL